MTDHELRKLDKTELLKILADLSEENKKLRLENAELRSKTEALKKESVRGETPLTEPKHPSAQKQEIGSIAEAALKVNGVFEAAQAAADEYLSAIRTMNANKDEDYRRIIKEAMFQANEIIKEAEAIKAKKIEEADAYCSDVTAKLSSGNQKI